MADLTITAADVAPNELAANIEVGTAGEAIDPGETVYLDGTDSKYKLGDNDTLIKATIAGIALTKTNSDGDIIAIQTSGSIIPGATLTQGQRYYQSANPGKIAPWADVASGQYVSPIFLATSSSEARIDIEVPEATIF